MQALNLQILESQNPKNQPKNFSSLKKESGVKVSFRDMVKEMSRLDAEKKDSVKNLSARNVSENAESIKTENACSKNELPDECSRSSNDENSRKENLPEVAVNEKKTEEKLDCVEVHNEKKDGSFLSVAAMPLDFTVVNENLSANESGLASEIPEEVVFVDDAEYSFLKTKAISNDDPLVIIENAVEYESHDDLLVNAQNLLIENPEEFLEGRKIASENSDASELTVAAFGNLEQNAASLEMAGSKTEDGFNIEVVNSSSESKPEATSLFKEIFTVEDNRSVEEKIAQFKSMVNENVKTASDNELNLSLSLSETAMQNVVSSNDQSAAATGSTFHEMLAQQVQANVPDFVKAGSIVLRDNNQGSINMILKPESLGNVKINLQVSDNVITGQITVHSKEAFEAFKQNMDSLRQAFQNSGYENAELNLSFADSSSSGAFAQGERQQSSEEYFGNRTYGNYAVSADAEDYSSESDSYGPGLDRQVSIVA